MLIAATIRSNCSTGSTLTRQGRRSTGLPRKADGEEVRATIRGMNVADLTIEDLKALIREAVEDAIEGLVNEPVDTPLRDEFSAQMRASLASGERGVPLDEVVGELGLDR